MMRRAFLLCALGMASLALAAHPANVPSAVVKVKPDHSTEIRVRFDMLAYVLDLTPQEASDSAMHALLDGTAADLQSRLDDAKNRFRADFSLIADAGLAELSVNFPTAEQIQQAATVNGSKRLPVMMDVRITATLPAGAKTVACKFPAVLGTVVLTTEVPYQEPVSEPVEPGALSAAVAIPAQSEIDKAAAAVNSPRTTEPTIADPATESGLALHLPADDAAMPALNIETEEAPVKPRKSAPVLVDFPKPQTLTQTKTAAAISPTTAHISAAPHTTSRPPVYVLLGRYVKMGYRHIVPEGLDHILFVLGLFLLSKKTMDLVKQISAFTAAHSITLGLSLYGVVQLPSSIVEPIIALSIAFIAVENLWAKEMKAWRPPIVFGFGLVHGLGFAGALKEVGLAKRDFVTGLLGFNVGVELGQLSVVALAFFAVGWLRASPRYRAAVVVPASCAIAAVALIWTFERTF